MAAARQEDEDESAPQEPSSFKMLPSNKTLVVTIVAIEVVQARKKEVKKK